MYNIIIFRGKWHVANTSKFLNQKINLYFKQFWMGKLILYKRFNLGICQKKIKLISIIMHILFSHEYLQYHKRNYFVAEIVNDRCDSITIISELASIAYRPIKSILFYLSVIWGADIISKADKEIKHFYH